MSNRVRAMQKKQRRRSLQAIPMVKGHGTVNEKKARKILLQGREQVSRELNALNQEIHKLEKQQRDIIARALNDILEGFIEDPDGVDLVGKILATCEGIPPKMDFNDDERDTLETLIATSLRHEFAQTPSKRKVIEEMKTLSEAAFPEHLFAREWVYGTLCALIAKTSVDNMQTAGAHLSSDSEKSIKDAKAMLLGVPTEDPEATAATRIENAFDILTEEIKQLRERMVVLSEKERLDIDNVLNEVANEFVMSSQGTKLIEGLIRRTGSWGNKNDPLNDGQTRILMVTLSTYLRSILSDDKPGERSASTIMLEKLNRSFKGKFSFTLDDISAVLSVMTAKKFVDAFTDLRKQANGPAVKTLAPAVLPGPTSAGLWQDAELVHVGTTLWNQTYRTGGDDLDASNAAEEMALNWAKLVEDEDVLVNKYRIGIIQTIAAFAAKWAVHAFQRITTSHTYGAALMCTDADRNVLEDIELQWHAFMVMLPNDLLGYEDPNTKLFVSYTRILVAVYADGGNGAASFTLLNQTEKVSSHRVVSQISNNLASVLDVEDPEMIHTAGKDLGDVLQGRVQRTVKMAKRLVAGLLLAMQNQNNFKVKHVPTRCRSLTRQHEEPAHRIVFVGSPLKIDCRATVKEYINQGGGKRKSAPPSVQTLVRGHFKRQVIGVGRSGRKVIWIQPFWRGALDAPIFTRPKKVIG